MQIHQQNRAAKQLICVQAATLSIAFCVFSGAQVQAQTLPTPAEPSLPDVVRPTDNLVKLGRGMLTSPRAWNEVAKFTQLKDPNLILPGQTLDNPLRSLKSRPASGRVISIEGDVTLGASAMQPAANLADRAKIKTGANSSAVIELGDGSRMKILPGSLAEIVTNRDYAMRDASKSGSTNWFSGLMGLSEGAPAALASKTGKRAKEFQVETPTSLIGVRGTGFRVAINDTLSDPLLKVAPIEVIEGLVRADNPAQASGANLPKGTGAVVNPLEKELKLVELRPAPDLAGITSKNLKPLGNWFSRVRGIDAVGLENFNSVKLIVVEDNWAQTEFDKTSALQAIK